MFNLIVQSQPWNPGRGSSMLGRMFEYTETAIEEQFRVNGAIDLPRLASFPCIFMEEGVHDQVARVGTIARPRLVGREVAFEFAFDPEIPPILNRVIHEHRADFDMPNEFEFSRNHWAVKDIDLYRVLLRLVRPRRQMPSVFRIDEHERIERQLISVMMPFDAAFANVYEAIQQAVTQCDLRCRRADEIWEAPEIIQDIVNLIDRSRAVICDCTGRNPNVFYEIGIAHTLGRNVILISQNQADIPFDLRHLRYIPYLNNGEGRTALIEALSRRLRTIVEA